MKDVRQPVTSVACFMFQDEFIIVVPQSRYKTLMEQKGDN